MPLSASVKRKNRKKRITLKKRKSVSFKCAFCGKTIKFLPSSRALRLYINHKINHQEAVDVLKGIHFRHAHTDYDMIIQEKYRSLQRKGLNSNKARLLSRMLSRKSIEEELVHIKEDHISKKQLQPKG